MEVAVGVPIIMTNNIHNNKYEIIGKPCLYYGEYYYYMCPLDDNSIEEGFYKNNIYQPDFEPPEEYFNSNVI